MSEREQRSKERIYAVDFGTSNSLLAAATPEATTAAIALDPAATDATVLKSIVYTPSAGTWFFGANAVNEYGEHGADGRLFRSLKKYLPDGGFTGPKALLGKGIRSGVSSKDGGSS